MVCLGLDWPPVHVVEPRMCSAESFLCPKPESLNSTSPNNPKPKTPSGICCSMPEPSRLGCFVQACPLGLLLSQNEALQE